MVRNIGGTQRYWPICNSIGRYLRLRLTARCEGKSHMQRNRGNGPLRTGKIWPWNFENSRLRLPILLCYDWYNPKPRYCIQYRYGDWYRYLRTICLCIYATTHDWVVIFCSSEKKVMFLSSMMLFHVFYLAPCINFPRGVIIPCFILCLDLDSRIAEGK